MAGNNFEFRVDLNVINHLGVGLYSSTAAALTELVDSGELKPVTDRAYPFEQIEDAFAYLEEGHAKGKVVVRL